MLSLPSTREPTLWLLRRLAGWREPLPLDRLGSDYGGWYVPLELVERDAIVYSVGIGEDITFDLELIRRRGCTVHAFDPTPRAQAHVLAQRDLPQHFRFHPYGIWRKEGEIRFYAPRDPAHVSHSIGNLQGTTGYFVGPVKTIAAAMRDLSHQSLDVLKLDIEGAEYAVVPQMLSAGIKPRILLLELHGSWPLPNGELLARLAVGGYRLAKVDGANVTLVHRSAARSRVPNRRGRSG